ncbi:cysteine-rich repeat protein [Thecamonas trahens ATCC 50062]|uniref:Cysteine-rich repeat protein n=1 Tax=Thecamonas trahens ATCC 50062 TaxID=461836 RepID=A0A0L0DB36_THETB|nr:cysteine-rich repeat protein [Thecamonas trahens ATCC 50062]KNC49311.1 cysteine-rich repeat protein [Thecamonas trahens ATCC 50062]|eukprot:XP_013758021.1 cysteine-rich repeat protein [Thecamonas trahens ATCC 50062]
MLMPEPRTAVLLLVLLGLLLFSPSSEAAGPKPCCASPPSTVQCTNETVYDRVTAAQPTCATTWGPSCVDTVRSEFPGYCPVPPTGCQATCDFEGPNGERCFWEECDDGNFNNTDYCTNSCDLARCGDGIVQAVIGEECDAGAANAEGGACLPTCKIARCGDGFVRTGIEACDDGNTNDADGCLSTCVLAVCGDGIFRSDPGSPEECDDGNAINTDGCLANCRLPRCGDGFVHAGVEACDLGTGNSDSLPNTCRLNCTLPTCGDGVIDSTNLEMCDPGGLISDSGCCVSCKFTPGACSSCMNLTHALQGTCVSGVCTTGAPVSCAPYVCDSIESICLTRCATDSQCLPGYGCSGSSVCVPNSELDAFGLFPSPPLSTSVVGRYAFLICLLAFTAVGASSKADAAADAEAHTALIGGGFDDAATVGWASASSVATASSTATSTSTSALSSSSSSSSSSTSSSTSSSSSRLDSSS